MVECAAVECGGGGEEGPAGDWEVGGRGGGRVEEGVRRRRGVVGREGGGKQEQIAGEKVWAC